MDVSPLKIGSLTIPVPLCLAPMAGYTRAPFRTICRRFHCGLVFTELVTADGIVRRQPKTLHYLASSPEERPVAAHIYGADPDSLAGAAEVIESLGRFDLIDINCGCPVPKVTRRGAGVALMREPEKIRTIVHAVSLATSLPVTVKTRLGISRHEFNISEVAQAAEEGGARALFLHARFASDRHSGPPDLDTLKRVKEERSIPVIGNGGITEAHLASEMMERTGVDGVMVGRAALGNPWIFAEIASLWSGRPYSPPSNADRRQVIAEHLSRLTELVAIQDRSHRRQRYTSEQAACHKFRAHLAKYLAGMPGSRKMLRGLSEIESIEAILAVTDEILGTSGQPGKTSEVFRQLK